jgi:hypothetical protein
MKLKAMRAAFGKWEAVTLRPISTLDSEINLLRVLTGHPAGVKYAGPVASTSDDTSSTDDSSDSSTTASTAPAAALPLPAFISGAGGEGGFAPGVSGSSGLGGQQLGPAVGVFGASGLGGIVPAVSAAEPAGPDTAAEVAALRREQRVLLQQPTSVSGRAPAQAAQGFAQAMTGVGRQARQRAAYSPGG